MLAVIVTVVVHCMERTFVCCSAMLGTGEVARGHTNRAAQCVPMCRIEVSSRSSDTITLTLHILPLLVSYSFYKIKIKFAAYHIVTKILRTDTYIYFIISDWTRH
jgi:hypothetical protein